MRRSYINVTIAVAGSLAGLMLGDTFVRRLWPLLNTETYRSILPPNAPRFISDLIQLRILFSAGAICGVTRGFTGGRRLRVPLAIAVYIYAFVKLLPYGFIEWTPAAFPIPVFGSGICAFGVVAGFELRNTVSTVFKMNNKLAIERFETMGKNGLVYEPISLLPFSTVLGPKD
jgi:hypothetical protein